MQLIHDSDIVVGVVIVFGRDVESERIVAVVIHVGAIMLDDWSAHPNRVAGFFNVGQHGAVGVVNRGTNAHVHVAVDRRCRNLGFVMHKAAVNGHTDVAAPTCAQHEVFD